jgi:hypothetical protein
MSDDEFEVTLNLAALGLAHHPDSTCPCDGTVHPVAVPFNPGELGLHQDYECPSDRADAAEAVLQELHEQAHPEGAVFAENCREPGCIDARDPL